MSRTDDLLELMLLELQGARSDLRDIEEALRLARPAPDSNDVHHAINALADRVTGPLGYHLGDVHERLVDVLSGLSAVETTIDLK